MLRFKRFCNENKKTLILAFSILVVSLIIFWTSDEGETFVSDYEIKRETYNGPKKNVTLDVEIGENEYKDIEIEINGREYSNEQLHSYFLKSHDLIKDRLAINTGCGSISQDISFDSSLPDSPLSYEWIPEDKDIVDETGKILIPYEVITSVKVIATYGEWSEDCVFEYKICPDTEIQNRYVREKIETLISEAEKDSRTDENLSLPRTIDDISIEYKDKEKGKDPSIILVGFILAIMILIASVYDKRSEKEKRKNEIVGEYPIVIQKLVMYISAGMTVRNAWTRICDTAEGNKNLIYEEMKRTENEILTGVSEPEAYEKFGQRINDNAIIRFTALLSQNIRKGSTSLSSLLREESERAFESRINRAKKKGEEAGTKLLLPMSLLLITVTVIIMIPAFWNM